MKIKRSKRDERATYRAIERRVLEELACGRGPFSMFNEVHVRLAQLDSGWLDLEGT